MIVSFISKECESSTRSQNSVRSLCGRVRLDQESAVDQPGQRPAEERPDPVNQLVVPVSARQGRPKCPGWIHGSAGKGTSEQNIQSDGQADREPSDAWCAGVHGR